MNPENAKEIIGGLDALIGSRQSVDKFKPEIPPRQSIMQIIQAGMLSPFAGLSRSGKDVRRFIVLPGKARQPKSLLFSSHEGALPYGRCLRSKGSRLSSRGSWEGRRKKSR